MHDFIDDKMAQQDLDHVANGRRFSTIVRDQLGIAPDYPFGQAEMIKAAERYGIAAAFNVYQHHWRLVLEVGDGLEQILVYDPNYPENREHVYAMRLPLVQDETYTNRSTTNLTRALVEYYDSVHGLDEYRKGLRAELRPFYKQSPTNSGWEEPHRGILHQNHYKLALPENWKHLKLQQDPINCGPLVVYAALIACLYDPKFRKLINFAQLKADGIEIPVVESLASDEDMTDLFRPVEDVSSELFRPVEEVSSELFRSRSTSTHPLQPQEGKGIEPDDPIPESLFKPIKKPGQNT